MDFIDNLITPQQLTGYLQVALDGGLPFGGAPADGSAADTAVTPVGSFEPVGPLPVIFEDTPVDDIYYELDNTTMLDAGEVARYRSWDTVAPLGKRPGIQIIGGQIVPLGWSYDLTEKELVRWTKLMQAIAGYADPKLIQQFFDDAMRAGRAVQNRITLAHAELLMTGGMTLTELGNISGGSGLVAQFPVPADQGGGGTPILPAVAWTDHTNADPATDFKTWEEVYANNNNDSAPTEWWMSRAYALHLLSNANLLKSIVSVVGQTNLAQIPSIDIVNQILKVKGVVAPVRVVEVRRPPLAGGARTHVFADQFVMGVQERMGSTLYAPPVVAGMMPADIRIEAGDQQGIIAYAQQGTRPPRVVTTAEAVAVPILNNPNGLFIVDASTD